MNLDKNRSEAGLTGDEAKPVSHKVKNTDRWRKHPLILLQGNARFGFQILLYFNLHHTPKHFCSPCTPSCLHHFLTVAASPKGQFQVFIIKNKSIIAGVSLKIKVALMLMLVDKCVWGWSRYF